MKKTQRQGTLDNEKWYVQREHGAGDFRLDLMFLAYRIFGVRFVKFWARLIAGIVGARAKSARLFSQKYREILNGYQVAHNITPSQFSPAKHIALFGDSLVDKMVAMCSTKNKIKFVPRDNADMREFQKYTATKQGVFLICNHVGNIAALAALPGGEKIKIHAFQQISQSGTFFRFIARHSVRKNTIIHPVEDMDIGTASEMFDALERGDLVMMAGDRISATNPDKTITVRVFGRDCKLPMGVFRFAKSMSHPVFAVSLINIGREKYSFIVKRLDETNTTNMANEFAEFLQESALAAPTQWFNFYDFFGNI